ncbi:hypothetical protein [Streptomyces pharetrae]|uniref:hypothetical protein n=1 Tax=Streptomyces pharetrae TaxID=291370 RepID=UPI003F4D9B86
MAARGDVLPAPSITRKRVDRYVTQPLGAVPNAGPVELTDWERETVALAARGLSDDESADHMMISPRTARTRINRATAEPRACDRTQLVDSAHESGLGTSLG